MGKKIDKAWQTNTYRKLAKAYYEDTVRDYAISGALLAQGITYTNENNYLVRVIEELLGNYDTDLCAGILDLVTYKEVVFVDKHDEDVICTTIDELLDAYGLTGEESTDEEKAQEE